MKANMRAYTKLKAAAPYVVAGKELQYKTLLRDLKNNNIQRRNFWGSDEPRRKTN